MSDGSIACPHCGHDWSFHSGIRCSFDGECGCMWQQPKQPEEPEPSNPLRDAIQAAIWAALREQDIYVDQEMGMVDTSGSWLDMATVADLVIHKLGFRRLEAGTWDDGLSFHRYITDWIADV